jgi:uncharacterized protein DUF3455
MTRLNRLCCAVGVGLAVATATLSMTQVANAALPGPTLPPESPIAVNSGEVFLIGHAKGVQIYTCHGNGDWGSSVPRADLVDDAGNLVVKHSEGPLWTAAADSSAFKGVKDVGVDSPAPARDIPWLRLSKAKDSPTSPVGGLLTDTKFIQRVNTQGGTPPPAAECKTQTLNKVKEVPYKADYYFWR